MDAVCLANFIVGKLVVERINGMPFISILEPCMEGSSSEVDLEIEPIDCAVAY